MSASSPWFPPMRGGRPRSRPHRPIGLVVGGMIIGVLLANVTVLAADQGEPGLVGVEPALAEDSDEDAEDRVAEPCEPWSLERRAAAVLLVGLPGVQAADDDLARQVLDLGVGGVFLAGGNVVDATQVRALVTGLRAGSPHPIVVATDEESGRVSSFGAVVGHTSSPRTLARRLTAAQLRGHARDIGAVLASAGVDLTFAPVVDLDAGPAGGIIGDRSFSMGVETATASALAFADGFADTGVRSTAKHFPGHGRSPVDSHRRLGRAAVTLDDLLEHDLVPFRALIEAGVPVVMTGHVAYDAFDDDLPASLSPAAYRLLRDLGFEGVAITDSLGMGAVHGTWGFGEAAVRAIAAGADAAMATDGRWAVEMRDALVAAVEQGVLDEARLSEAAARMRWLAGDDPWPATCTELTPPTGPLAIPPP